MEEKMWATTGAIKVINVFRFLANFFSIQAIIRNSINYIESCIQKQRHFVRQNFARQRCSYSGMG